MTSDPLHPDEPLVDPAVWEAYLRAPEHMVTEILEGELFSLPRPRPAHARGSLRLTGRLRAFDDPDEGEPGGWTILPEPELHLGRRPDVVIPDVAGWTLARMPSTPTEAAITLAPDWVCEVISPSTEALDRGKKRRIYRREGVRWYWLLNVELRTLEVYRLVDGRWLEVETYEGDVRVRAEPFDAIEIDLGRLWPTPAVSP
ncbi:MAG: Uma2 family endonuclease [Deltaproteobacteria bacterium]|nr:Uma2 family endonuclease [Myxococcales bacterium]MDP3213849.1 Uma2 family endonuclease [Deltaproteobacteria bacterium]